MLPEGWRYTEVQEVAKVVRGASPRPQGDPRFYGGDVPRLMVADVTRDGKFVSPKIDFLTEEGAKRSRPMPKGTLTIVCSGVVGIPSILAVDACIHDGFLALEDVKKDLLIDYGYYVFSNMQKDFDTSATHGGIFTNLTTTILKEFVFPLPPLSEQKKIAAILSTWDRAIEGTEKLLANSQQQKKALMQQLLTGKKRLPGFTGEWNIRKFQDLFHERTETDREDLPLLSVTANDGVIFQEDSGRKNISKEDKSKYKRICVGDIGYNTMRMWQGRSCLSDKEGIVSPAYTIVFAKKDICTIFASYLFKFSPLIHVFYRHSQGLVSDTWNLKFKHFKEISWEIPPLPEQKAIAAILSTADEEITAIESDLLRLRQEKKALMQQLLTGKRRVTVD